MTYSSDLIDELKAQRERYAGELARIDKMLTENEQAKKKWQEEQNAAALNRRHEEAHQKSVQEAQAGILTILGHSGGSASLRSVVEAVQALGLDRGIGEAVKQLSDSGEIILSVARDSVSAESSGPCLSLPKAKTNEYSDVAKGVAAALESVKSATFPVVE